ncbi:MAG: Crp/Fnr family transcriptional regulator [Pyrinomonadaceae bacterium]
MNDIALGFTTTNLLLNALPAEDLQRLTPDIERVELTRGAILYNPGDVIDFVYFPESAMISLVAFTEAGEATEVSVIGDEGAAGLEVLMGARSPLNSNMVQIANSGYRISAEKIRSEFKRGGAFHDLALGFTRKLMSQMGQIAFCNRLHTAEVRLARWLLMCEDRAHSDVLGLTQESIAVMLGSSRSTVTVVAIELQKTGFISYSRGKIQILDRPGLEAFSCTCYRTIQSAYQGTN